MRRKFIIVDHSFSVCITDKTVHDFSEFKEIK
jgi:hypothetical protein